MEKELTYHEWFAFLKNCALRPLFEAACKHSYVKEKSNQVKCKQEQIGGAHDEDEFAKKLYHSMLELYLNNENLVCFLSIEVYYLLSNRDNVREKLTDTQYCPFEILLCYYLVSFCCKKDNILPYLVNRFLGK